VAVRAGTRGRLRATRQPAAHSNGTGGRALLTGDQTISTVGGASMAGRRCRLTGCLSLGVQSSIIPSRTGEVRPAGGVIPSRQAARANRARSFRRRTEQPSRPSWARPDAGMPLHQTMSHSPAAVAASSVIGGCGRGLHPTIISPTSVDLKLSARECVCKGVSNEPCRRKVSPRCVIPQELVYNIPQLTIVHTHRDARDKPIDTNCLASRRRSHRDTQGTS